ncbi:KGGVGR-motif variant AAA ATPase [Methanocalculus sp. MC3]
MILNKGVLFEEALSKATELAKNNPLPQLDELIYVRDLRGRIRLILSGKCDDYSDEEQKIQLFAKSLSEQLGVYGYPPDQSILFAGDLMIGEEILVSPDRRLIAEGTGVKLWLIDRQITGQDWMRQPLERTTRNQRVTFFGVKGGVGRSTALIIWAWHLAKKGKKVIIFDLDLESPGVSSTLLPNEHLPDYGIVDWFVEDGVGQGNIIQKEMVGISPISRELIGDLWIVPAYGRMTGDYLPKLARTYAESSESGDSWGDRLQYLVEQIEVSHHPDIVILDSRAGIHDIAAVSVTRMDADALFFAVDSPQTWKAYSFLFENFNKSPSLKELRNRFRIVASMVPEVGRKQYMTGFTQNAWDLFMDYLYEETGDEDQDYFSYDLKDEDAPHHPLPIFWHRALQEFNPIASEYGIDEKTIEEAMKECIAILDRLYDNEKEVHP